MALTLVTNKSIENENYNVLTFAQFIEEATEGDGLSYQGDFFYIDVDALPDENYYETILGAEMGNKWVLLEGEVPEWFHSEIDDTPDDLDETKLQDADVSVLADAIAFLDKEPDPDAGENEEKKAGTIITFGSAKGGSGKQLEKGTPILAEHGWKPVEQIKVGEKVWTPKGTLTEVTGFFPQGKKPLYRFETMAGQWVNCGLEHQWTVTKFDRTEWETVTTQELLDRGLEAGHGRSHYYKWAIPVSKTIPFEEKDLPVNPYVLGAMIGDGCCTETPLAISSKDEHIVAKIAEGIEAKEYKPHTGDNFTWYFYTGNKAKFSGNERIQTEDVLSSVPEVLCKAKDKHIPDMYKFSSVEQRWELIQGLFDTDGTCYIKPNRKACVAFSTTSERLANDVREILYSLGVEARISVEDRRGQTHISSGKAYERQSVEYQVRACCPVELYTKFFTLPRKLEIAQEAIKDYEPQSDVRRYDRVSIKSIEYAKDEEAYCIAVADEDKLYITKDYIVTHNTFTSLITAYYYAKEHPDKKVALLDLDIREPQVSAVLKELHKSIKPYYTSYTMGKTDFKYLEKCKYNHKGMPENLDFYLSVKEQYPIDDQEFWETLMTKLFFNYDMVFLDTGTEYLDMPAIITAYKVADRINIVCMPNMASSVIVTRQLKYLTGETENKSYSKEDELEDKLNLVFTNYYDNNITNSIVKGMSDRCEIAARFANITPQIDEVEVLNKWDHFDDNEIFRQGVRALYGEI